MIGVRGHDIGKMSAEKLAQRMEEQGFGAIQLVAYKCIQGISEKAGFLSPGLAYKVSREFDKRGIHIALLGSYFNLLEQDEQEFNEAVKRFKEYLCFAKDFKCHMVGTETGSFNKDMSYHPYNHSEEALQKVIGIFKDLTQEAEKYGVMVGVEGLYDFVVSTPKRMKRLLDEVASNNLQVIFDPVNLVHTGNYKDIKEMIEEAFALYGDKIALIHAKDFVVKDGKVKTVQLGKGLMDFEHLISLTNKYKPSIDIIIEDLRDQELEESHLFLKSIYDDCF